MQGNVILATDTNHRFLLAGTKSLLPQCNKCLNATGNYAELWCVPSATYVSCIHGSQNDVLGIREYDTCPHSHSQGQGIYIYFRITTETTFPNTLFRQILISLTFRPLKLMPTHCLSHLLKQRHIPQQWWRCKTSHCQYLQNGQQITLYKRIK